MPRIKISYDNLEETRGPLDALPAGTKQRLFLICNETDNVSVYAIIFFMPDGNRLFHFFTEQFSVAYTPQEVALIHFFLGWVSQHKAELYPEPPETATDGQLPELSTKEKNT